MCCNVLAVTLVLESMVLLYPERTRRYLSAHALWSECEVRDVVSPRVRVLQRSTSFAFEGAYGSCGEGPSGAREGHIVTRRVVSSQADWRGKEHHLRSGRSPRVRPCHASLVRGGGLRSSHGVPLVVMSIHILLQDIAPPVVVL